MKALRLPAAMIAVAFVPVFSGAAVASDQGVSIRRAKQPPVIVIINPEHKEKRRSTFSLGQPSGERDFTIRRSKTERFKYRDQSSSHDTDGFIVTEDAGDGGGGFDAIIVERPRRGPKVVEVKPDAGKDACDQDHGVCIIRP